MKKKSASRSAFFNVRVLIGLFIVLAGVLLALASSGVLSATAQSVIQGMAKGKIITSSSDPLVPVGFDCSTIYEKGINKQENFRAGAIMIACGETPGAATSATSTMGPVGQFIKKLLLPLAYGAADVDVITGTETFPDVTQSETYTTANPDNPSQIGVAYNDSRGRFFNPINISGASFSTDGGTTFTRLTKANGQSPFDNTLGDPVLLYNRPTSTWFAIFLDIGCGGQGVGGYKSTTPTDPNSWTHFCVHTGSFDDRESGVVDQNPSSPFHDRMYVSWNDFNRGEGLFVRFSTDNGLTWTNERQLSTTFFRDVQITTDKVTGDVYVAAMDEMGGGLTNRANKIYRSTDGGNTWLNTYTGPSFPAPGRVNCSANPFFVCMYSPDSWRHQGWGEPAAFNHVVSLVYDSRNTGNSDPADVYYIRSTDSGVTFSAPFKLNTDSTTRAQWQPNLSVSEAGTLFSVWYDERETTNPCTVGSPSSPCYRMWARKSNDGGVTWLPDDMFSDVITPVPGQPDSGIQPNYQGDYDYGSAILTKHLSSWDDGRVTISGQSQQDVFTDRELVGFAVTSTIPACNALINTQPMDFTVNLSDAADPNTVQPTDFTVNGTSANTATLMNGNTQIIFHFNSSPVVQGPNTMHIPAGAINRASDGMGIFEFLCTFCYDTSQLMVTSTNPPVGGTFSPPAPGDYQYDVNFNLAVDPASVQTSDLTLTGNAGGSVTNVQLVNGNMTARFTVHFNFGGSATATIGAGSITAHTCNVNAAFTGDYTVSGCPPQNHYTITQIGGSIVPGTTDTGNHCDDCTTGITLPFSYTLYDQTYTAANVDSNGTFQFVSPLSIFTNSCLPDTSRTYIVFPYWDDLRTDNVGFPACASYPGGTCGVFTSISGTAPNRIFNVEFRATYFANTSGQANFEVRLYEGQSRFDVIYGTVANGNASATAGVQKVTDFDQYFCNGSGGAATGGQSYILQSCNPSPTPTASPSPTPTATATATATATGTPTATATATFTPTPRPTPTPRSAPTPRPRPTPAPRP